jgi:hypothetical protein
LVGRSVRLGMIRLVLVFSLKGWDSIAQGNALGTVGCVFAP